MTVCDTKQRLWRTNRNEIMGMITRRLWHGGYEYVEIRTAPSVIIKQMPSGKYSLHCDFGHQWNTIGQDRGTLCPSTSWVTIPNPVLPIGSDGSGSTEFLAVQWWRATHFPTSAIENTWHASRIEWHYLKLKSLKHTPLHIECAQATMGPNYLWPVFVAQVYKLQIPCVGPVKKDI